MANVNAFIGCRLGSTRVKFKNLSLLDEKPLFTYLTNSALKSSNIDNLFLNTDSKYIVDVAKKIYKNKLNYYIRPSHLGSSKAKLDDFVYDFMINFPSEITIFFNPCCLFLKIVDELRVLREQFPGRPDVRVRDDNRGGYDLAGRELHARRRAVFH